MDHCKPRARYILEYLMYTLSVSSRDRKYSKFWQPPFLSSVSTGRKPLQRTISFILWVDNDNAKHEFTWKACYELQKCLKIWNFRGPFTKEMSNQIANIMENGRSREANFKVIAHSLLNPKFQYSVQNSKLPVSTLSKYKTDPFLKNNLILSSTSRFSWSFSFRYSHWKHSSTFLPCMPYVQPISPFLILSFP